MDALARVSLVNDEGNVLLDTFVAVKERVTDYRTWVSGVRPQDLEGAPSLEDVLERVSRSVEGRTLVGHGLTKDLKVLLLSHPRRDIRDTAKYPPFMFSRGGKRRPQALRQLAKKELGLDIQEGEHSSVDDARAALYLYHKVRREWERAVRANAVSKLPAAGQVARKHASYGARDVRDDPMADL
ncbi:MAG: ribonuclease H-like domain-containing protein [Monoraphidium minutum]|nr:MAG: ribonuclease H-like domain-containing protein [Monoraphidium minutum]